MKANTKTENDELYRNIESDYIPILGNRYSANKFKSTPWNLQAVMVKTLQKPLVHSIDILLHKFQLKANLDFFTTYKKLTI